MKKLYFSFLSLLLLSGPLLAQNKADNRTIPTRVADLLAMFPAQNSQQLNTNLNEMSALGEAGILEMVKMLVPPDQGDNTKIEYALGGYSYFVSQNKLENLRSVAANAYVKA